MKLKNEEEKMKIFSARPKISNWYFVEYLNFADSKSVLRFFISFLDQKLESFKEGLKRPKRAKVDPLCRAVTFDPRKIWKIWKQIWNQRSSNILKSINSVFLAEPKKSLIFCLHFSSSFFNFQKDINQLKYSAKNYLFNGV